MDETFDIYATPKGLVQVSNPVRKQMLTNLSGSDLTLTEMSNMTGKAQSTLSVHLEKMAGDGLVSFREDPADSRRKIFSLSSRLMARSREIKEEGQEVYHKTIESSVEQNSNFFKVLLRSLIVGAEASGLCIGPTMRSLGKSVGKALAKKMTSSKVEDIIGELQEFYERNDAGEVCVYTFMPLTIIVRDNFEVMQCAAESISVFSQALFLVVLQTLTKKEYKITYKESFGLGNNYSKFVIEQVI